MNESFRAYLFAAALSAVAAASREPEPSTEAADTESVENAIRASYDQPLKRLEATAVPDSEDLFIAICDWEDHWWGEFICVKVEDGKITRKAKFENEDDAPDEQSVLSARPFRDSGFENPLVEVFGQTHMGNGSLYLYELRGDTLHLLLKTRAVDSHDDGAVIRGGALSAEYRDLDGDGHTDVRLSGVIERTGDDSDDGAGAGGGMPPPATEEVEKVFVWDKAAGRYVEVIPAE